VNTWKDAKNVLLVLIAVVSVAIMGCGTMVDMGTPAMRPKITADYSGKRPGITTLATLKDERALIVIKHRTAQTSLKREAQDDKLFYQDALTYIEHNIKESQIMQDMIIGAPDQPFSILGLLGGMAGGAAIGRALKRKGDMTPEEVDLEFAKRELGDPVGGTP